MSKSKPVRGFRDLLHDTYILHEAVISAAAKTAQRYGFSTIDIPVLEHSEVYSTSLGEDSDVVLKEMYTFIDKGDRSLTMRPEFTAGVQRALRSNGLFHQLPLKLFLHGPLFRYERPQKGRYRQFHQINFEHIGVVDSLSDFQMIHAVNDILKNLRLTDHTYLEINSLGCSESRQLYQAVLKEYFLKYENDLSHDSKIRLQRNNPLRILDSKSIQDIQIIESAPKISNSYTKMALTHFNLVLEYLNYAKISYQINEKLVRGLDYYTDTVFEFKTQKLGTQDTVFAGGRYLCTDDKNNVFGAVGCAGGVERLSLLIEADCHNTKKDIVVIIPLTESYNFIAIDIFNKMLLSNNIGCVLESSGSLKKKMKNANSINAKYVLFIGKEEVKNNCYTLKNLLDGSEMKIDSSSITSFFKDL